MERIPFRKREKTVGNLRNIYGNIWEIYGNIWKYMEMKDDLMLINFDNVDFMVI